MYKLETRVCECGCKRTFRVLPTSKQRWFSDGECNPETQRLERQSFNAYTIPMPRLDYPPTTPKKKRGP